MDVYRLLVVEGSLGGGYENGLENAVMLASALAARGWPMEVQIVARWPRHCKPNGRCAAQCRCAGWGW